MAANEALADDLDSGVLSAEQLDLIADAMGADESAASDQDLMDDIAATTVDQGRKIAAGWKARKTSKDKAESEHERQRRLRRAYRYSNKAKGLDTVVFEGDTVSISEIWNLLQQGEKRLHEADGGRDLASCDHPRTRDQRLFDALHGFVTGRDGSGSARPSAARPSAVVTIAVDQSDNAELVGSGPMADSAVRDLLLRAGVSVMLVEAVTGAPLWLSRRVRHAKSDQFLALVVCCV